MRKNTGIILFGTTLIGVAIAMIGNLMGFWQIENFHGWWTMFLIIPGIWGIIKFGFTLWNSALILIGVWLLIDAQGIIFGITKDMLFAILLLLFGILFIGIAFKRNKKANTSVINKMNDDNDIVNYTALFSVSEVSNSSKELKEITLESVFGGIKLDLTEANLIDGAVIKAESIFGGIDIRMPKGCKIKVTGVPIFGGLKNTYNETIIEGSPLVIIEYSAIFGGIEIK